MSYDKSLRSINSFKELIEIISIRPALYIGYRNVHFLSAFIHGWRFGKGESVTDLNRMTIFQRWIEQKYEEGGGKGWADILLESAGSQVLAFDLFFKKYEEFSILYDSGKLTDLEESEVF